MDSPFLPVAQGCRKVCLDTEFNDNYILSTHSNRHILGFELSKQKLAASKRQSGLVATLEHIVDSSSMKNGTFLTLRVS